MKKMSPKSRVGRLMPLVSLGALVVLLLQQVAAEQQHQLDGYEILVRASNFLRARTPETELGEVLEVLQQHSKFDHEEPEPVRRLIESMRALRSAPQSGADCAEFGPRFGALSQQVAGLPVEELGGAKLKAVELYLDARRAHERYCA